MFDGLRLYDLHERIGAHNDDDVNFLVASRLKIAYKEAVATSRRQLILQGVNKVETDCES